MTKEEYKKMTTEKEEFQSLQLAKLDGLPIGVKVAIKTEPLLAVFANKSVEDRPEEINIFTQFGASIFTYHGTQKSELFAVVEEVDGIEVLTPIDDFKKKIAKVSKEEKVK